jgi:hypothetical protein
MRRFQWRTTFEIPPRGSVQYTCTTSVAVALPVLASVTVKVAGAASCAPPTAIDAPLYANVVYVRPQPKRKSGCPDSPGASAKGS